MENLLNPDVGLMFWTVVTFLLLLIVLKKAAWSPMLKAIDDREAQMKQEEDTAKKNREDSENLRQEYENRLADIEQRARIMLADAEHQAAAKREEMMKSAEQEVRTLVEKTRFQLEGEKQRLIQELRQEVVKISLQATEKLIAKSVDSQTEDKLLQELVTDLSKK